MTDVFDKIAAKARSIASDIDKAELARDLMRTVDRYLEKEHLFQEARASGLDPYAFIAELRRNRGATSPDPASGKVINLADQKNACRTV